MQTCLCEYHRYRRLCITFTLNFQCIIIVYKLFCQIEMWCKAGAFMAGNNTDLCDVGNLSHVYSYLIVKGI